MSEAISVKGLTREGATTASAHSPQSWSAVIAESITEARSGTAQTSIAV